MNAHPPYQLVDAHCASCRFFHEHAAASGDCHRYPPVFSGNDTPNERHRWKHPLVPHNNWCGEYQGRGTPQGSVLNKDAKVLPVARQKVQQ